jgi:hypothetical protein
MAPQSKGGQELKKKPLKTTKADFETPKALFVCCSVTIGLQR